MDVKIVDFEETQVAVLKHQGDPALLNDSALVFIEWRQQSGLSPKQSSRTFGVVYDDPNTTAPEQFRFDICGEVCGGGPENPRKASGFIPCIPFIPVE